jgi:hypothetical protein
MAERKADPFAEHAASPFAQAESGTIKAPRSPLSRAVIEDVEALRERQRDLEENVGVGLHDFRQQLAELAGQNEALRRQVAAELAAARQAAPQAAAPQAPEQARLTINAQQGKIDWDLWHDPRIQRAWDGTDTPQFREVLAQALAERAGASGYAPQRTPRCPLCSGTGRQSAVPAGTDWTPCTACDAAEFFRLHRDAYSQRSEAVGGLAGLQAARQRVRDCTECHQVYEPPPGAGRNVGTGMVFTPAAMPPPCTLCKGTGEDPDVEWRAADDTHQQRTLAAAPGLEPREGEPPFLAARRQALAVPVSTITSF